METFEFILILLACVIVSAVLDQIISRVSLPLIQIGIGLLAGLLISDTSMFNLDSELFLVLFIAPLLFDEARHTDARRLWRTKWSVLSLAVGLVVAIVLVIGFSLHLMIPSITLTAAFACGAALGPTDAAAVAALGQTVHLTRRQKTLLSGESLINDASGVVSFQFAIAAVITGTFSLVDAGAKFAILFFGGILVGAVMGRVLRYAMRVIRARGYESTTVHVTYEVLSPFVVYLASEALGVSGILAVVAAGIAMAEPPTRLTSTSMTRHRFVSAGVWEVLIFLINGFLFVMLGMQLPLAMNPAITVDPTPTHVLVLYVLALTALLEGVRFVWTSVMELRSRDNENGQRGTANVREALRRAATLTVAGPKGAVTLSIIFTIPVFANGAPFPNRDLIIFLTAGVILCTLLIADMTLPLLAPTPDDAPNENTLPLEQARVEVLSLVIQELQNNMESRTHTEYEPATRAVIAQYRRRIILSERTDVSPDTMTLLRCRVLDAQCAYLDKVREENNYDPTTISRFQRILVRRRKLMGADMTGLRSARAVSWARRRVQIVLELLNSARRSLSVLRAPKQDPDTTLAMTPVQRQESEALAARLERVAIELLKSASKAPDATNEERRAATALLEEHRVALASVKARQAGRAQAAEAAEAQANSTADAGEVEIDAATGATSASDSMALSRDRDGLAGSGSGRRSKLSSSLQGSLSALGNVAERIRLMRKEGSSAGVSGGDSRTAAVSRAYAANMSRVLGIDVAGMTPGQAEHLTRYLGQVEEGALAIELDKIRHLVSIGRIDAPTARELRQDTYVLQMGVTDR